jgi:hypothetical protein
MYEFDFSGWAAFGVGSFVLWEEESFTQRHRDLFQELTPEEREEMMRQATPEEAELLAGMSEMSIRINSEQRATLIERHPDRLVVETWSRTTRQGRRNEFTSREILLAHPPPEPEVQVISRWEDGKGNSAVVEKRSWSNLTQGKPALEGDETIEVAGRPTLCRWSDRSVQLPMGALQIRTWRCDDIPGGIARYTMRMDRPDQLQTVQSRIVKFERKELRPSP